MILEQLLVFLEQLFELSGLLGDLGLLVGFPVLVGWVVIRGLALAGRDLSNQAKKWVIYGLSVVSMFVFQPIPLPALGNEPGVALTALLAFAGAVMKVAQTIYDRAWTALEEA